MHFEPEEVTDAGGNGDEGHVDKKIHGQLGENDAPGGAGAEEPGQQVIKEVHLHPRDGEKNKVPSHFFQPGQRPGAVRAHQGADRFGEDGAGHGGEKGGEPKPARILPNGEGIHGRADYRKIKVGEIKSDSDGLKDKEDPIVFFDRQEARPEGGPKAPRGGQAVRPRRKCRSRRSVWPWD